VDLACGAVFPYPLGHRSDLGLAEIRVLGVNLAIDVRFGDDIQIDKGK
jgi:hypothetical protein